MRLVCNLLDGMVAIEGGRKSKVGAIYNEFPDRIADTLFLVPLGYAAGMPWLGWACALLAALTAYVRVFGGALGLAQDFSGVMAKQRRMAALTVGLVVQAVGAALLRRPLAAAGHGGHHRGRLARHLRHPHHGDRRVRWSVHDRSVPALPDRAGAHPGRRAQRMAGLQARIPCGASISPITAAISTRSR